jgi:hypothetical protein
MKTSAHGITSLLFVFLAIVTGFYAIFVASKLLALAYVLFIPPAFLIILYSYCAKCVTRDKCAHIFPGRLVRLFPNRKQDAYTFSDYTGVIIPLLAILVFPQYWLWKYKWLLIVFWFLLLIAVLEINRFVCTRCLNSACVLCKNEECRNRL